MMPEDRKLRLFLCHASQDKPAVRELYKRLEAEGWIHPWLDEENLYPGQEWDLKIQDDPIPMDELVQRIIKGRRGNRP